MTHALADPARMEPAPEKGGLPGLAFRQVSKRLGAVQAVDAVDLAISEGEFFTLLGPSGSGKTTSLNLVAGFLTQDSGRIEIRGRAMDGVPPERRDVGIVFQNYALFPHLSLIENVAFPLRRRGIRRAQAHARAREALALVALDGREQARPAALSGGQQQRAALARALVFEPKLILLDEPLGALDRRLRQRLQLQLRELHQRLRFTALYITHDQEEALALSDRIGIMNEGRLVQVGTGQECYRRPVSMFAANFLGDANVVAAQVVDRRAPGCVVRIAADPQAQALAAWHPPGAALRAGDTVNLVARPEALVVRVRGEADAPAPLYAHGHLVGRIFLGQDVLATVAREDGDELLVRERPGTQELRGQPGDAVDVVWNNAEAAVVLPGEAPA